LRGKQYINNIPTRPDFAASFLGAIVLQNFILLISNFILVNLSTNILKCETILFKYVFVIFLHNYTLRVYIQKKNLH